jgi:ATP diphosphatase
MHDDPSPSPCFRGCPVRQPHQAVGGLGANQSSGERDIAAASTLEGVPLTLPAMSRAVKLQSKAARVGFDWPAAAGVLDKIAEELAEIRAELETGATAERLAEELGDLLFACVNLSRHLEVDPESALRAATAKFERRFRCIENWLAETGRTPQQATLVELDALWERAKAEEGRE